MKKNYAVRNCSDGGSRNPYIILLGKDLRFSLHDQYGGSVTLRNIGILPHHYMVSETGRPRLCWVTSKKQAKLKI
jgi:hypothetical protein